MIMSIADFCSYMRATYKPLEAVAFWQWNAALHDALKEHREICWIYGLIPTFDSTSGV